ncbi:MAG: NADH:ubiquinone reductase (Na(+)-transporting) subunit B [Owenweeksia sp.]|nr:NADH:ubiquinone reductase (Na(+)-transporting) subunit B [Owenweeksia sp.]MBF98974.1 NADH:ubiquinone reductase (Na(+)-transporting) subunit B [Owenweeksia sp.]HBF21151.1 NADH:ubiquinone reductase (Na(+)-transporting) subunit B [Cryomorphaceae bacterium]HCQ14655.1 NADH:ubiquinone reductase (Na(+)-transporting) subunit B [Cryomorphaceae bacterium]|tara:strand:- start:684 stop:1874 length:1191 start_codon:yes stop_codon:yes gene_type:complete
MKLFKNLLESVKPHFEKGGKLEKLYPVYDGFATFLFVPGHTAHSGAHVRDGIDLKRTMITVVLALVPALLFGMWNVGYQHYKALGETVGFWDQFLFGAIKVVPMVVVSYAVGLGIEFAFCVIKKHQINEGYLVTGMLIPLIMPVDIPLWMVALSVVFAVVLGKEVFGGTGMNILNPALTARAFAFFAYPSYMSGDKVWINTSTEAGQSVVDGYSGATALGELATTGSTSLSPMDMFIGSIPGSIGETSVIAILIGAAILLITGIGSWRIMFSALLGGVAMGLIFNWVAPYATSPEQQSFMGTPFWQHLIMGGFAFGIVFMATDPVSAAQTTRGKWIYGFLVGLLCIMIRVFNPAYPEGVMMAILFMNVMAPLIDHYVIEANIKRRKKRVQVKVKTA